MSVINKKHNRWILAFTVIFFSGIASPSGLALQQKKPVISWPVQESADTLTQRSTISVWVFFTDKGFITSEGLKRRLAEPSALITERSIDRRMRRGSKAAVVGFDDIPVYNQYIRQVTAIDGVLHHRTTSKWFNGVSLEVQQEALAPMADLPFVRGIDLVKKARVSPPDNSSLVNQSSLQKTTAPQQQFNYGQSFTQLDQINVIAAHEAGYSGDGILVLMLDTGYFKDHEAIDTSRIVAEWDFIHDDGNTQNDNLDSTYQDYHGTITTSVLGAAVDGVMYGPAFKSRFLLAKTEIESDEIIQEEDYYVEALEWGDSLGADVASSSLGYFDWYEFSDLDGNTAITTRAVDKAVSNGMVCVTAAGNENGTLWDHIIAPADADSVISVGAVDSEGKIAGFSSRGPTYDGRIKPEVVAMGVQTFCAYPTTPTSYKYVNGTSLSTPLVGGAVALILEAHPDWTPMEIRRALMETASRSNVPNNTYGWGIIDVMKAINFSQPTLQELASIRNYPNPVIDQTTFEIIVPRELPDLGELSLTIFNLKGESVAKLTRIAGTGAFQWDLRAAPWNTLPNGVYIYRLTGASLNLTNKLTLLR